MNVHAGVVGNIGPHDGVGGHILYLAGLKRRKGALEVLGGGDGGVVELVGDGPGAVGGHLRGNLGGSGVRRHRGVGGLSEQRHGGGQIRVGSPEARGIGLVHAHDHVDLAGGERTGGVGGNVHDLELQAELIGQGGCHVDVDADDLRGRGGLAGQRSVVCVDADAQDAFLGDDGLADRRRGLGRRIRFLLLLATGGKQQHGGAADGRGAACGKALEMLHIPTSSISCIRKQASSD